MLPHKSDRLYRLRSESISEAADYSVSEDFNARMKLSIHHATTLESAPDTLLPLQPATNDANSSRLMAEILFRRSEAYPFEKLLGKFQRRLLILNVAHDLTIGFLVLMHNHGHDSNRWGRN
jgi:hypothetical protein